MILSGCLLAPLFYAGKKRAVGVVGGGGKARLDCLSRNYGAVFGVTAPYLRHHTYGARATA